MTTGPLLEKASRLLLGGASKEQVIASCARDGYPEPDTAGAVEAVLAHPLYRMATVLAVRLRARDWLLRAQSTLAQLGEGAAPVGLQSREDFFARYYTRNRPAVFRALAAHWPATSRWTADYLAAICGDTSVEFMRNRNRSSIQHQYFHDSLRQSMSFGEYLSLVHSGQVTNDYYMVSRNRFFANPRTHPLLQDLQLPDFVQIDDPGEDVRMWLGPAGTVTPLHFDDVNSLLVQVVGRKRIRLYGPHHSSEMRQAEMFYADTTRAMIEVPGAGHVFDLQPGDAVFIPVGWWHSVVSFDVSVMLSFTNFGLPNSFGTP